MVIKKEVKQGRRGENIEVSEGDSHTPYSTHHLSTGQFHSAKGTAKCVLGLSPHRAYQYTP